MDVEFNARDGPTNINGCMNVTSGLPDDIVGTIEPICADIALVGFDFAFKSCDIKIGDTDCAVCEVCDNKRGIRFNCSNININPSVDPVVVGPAIDQCQLLGFLPAPK